MSSDKYAGSINLSRGGGKAGSYETELNASIQAYEDYGFQMTPDMTQQAFITAVGRAFISSELPPVALVSDLGPRSKQYFSQEVQPQLAAAAEREEPKALALAYRMGRLLSANVMNNPGSLPAAKDFQIGPEKVMVDGLEQPYDIATGWVVDFGMGLYGLLNHMPNVKAGRYSVIGIQKTHGERAALQGVAAHRKLSADDMQIFAGGIESNAEGLIENSGENLVDMVIASRVHEAGTDLEAGVALTSKLLRAGGLLIARGPRRYAAGTDYDRLHGMVRKDPNMTVLATKQYARTAPNGSREDNLAFVAQAA